MAEEFIPNWSDGDIGSSKIQIKTRLKKNWTNSEGLASDAPRVLKLIRDNWKEYMRRVSEDCSKDQEEIIKLAKESPANLYVFLINKVIFRKSGNRPMLNASDLTIWEKMPSDAKFLYEDKFFIFQKAFNPEKIRDFVRSIVTWPF